MAEKLIDMAVRLDEESRARHARMSTEPKPVGWTKEQGMVYTPDGAYYRRQDVDSLLAELATVKAQRDELLAEKQEGRKWRTLRANMELTQELATVKAERDRLESSRDEWRKLYTEVEAELTRLRGEQKVCAHCGRKAEGHAHTGHPFVEQKGDATHDICR